jgi:hypothetical protein
MSAKEPDYCWAYREAQAEAFPPVDDIACEYADLLMGNETRKVSFGLDPGIKKYMERLQDSGIETFESCEGGKGHAYPEPTIRFHGTPEAGWRALAACLAFGFPVLYLRRIWCILDGGEPNGPYWEVVFRRPA